MLSPLYFQGLAVSNPNIAILCVACSKMHALSSHWNSDSVILGKILWNAHYEHETTFQVEVGL